MKSLTSALSAALGAPVQQPAILVEVAFATVRRWSSFASLTWNGQSWVKEAVRVEGLAVDALRVAGTLVIGNGDDGAGALVLGEGVTDRSIRIWGYDAAATATADVVWLCDAVGGAAMVGDSEVRIELRHKTELMLGPRTFITEATFGTLLPAGAVLRINGVDVALQRKN